MRVTEKKRWLKQMAIGVIVLLSILVFAACGIAIWDNDLGGDNIHIGCCDSVIEDGITEEGGSAVETAAFATQNWNPAVLTYNFSLTNNSQALNNVPAGARFRIEVWGGSGGNTATVSGGRGGRSVGEFQNMTNAPMNLLVQAGGWGGHSPSSNAGGGGGASAVWANTVSTANVLIVGGGGGGGAQGGVGGGGNANGGSSGATRVGLAGLNNGTGGNGGRCCCGGGGQFATASRGGNQGQPGLSATGTNAQNRPTQGCHQAGGGGGIGAGGGSGRGGCCGGAGTGNPGSGVNGGSSSGPAGGGGASWNGARGTGNGAGGGQGQPAVNGAGSGNNSGGGGGGFGGGGGGEGISGGGGGGFAGGGGGANASGGGGSGFVRTSHIAGVINFVGGAGGTSGATDSPGGHNGHVRITLLVVPPDQVTFPATRVLTRGVVASGTGAGQMPAFTVSGSGHTQSIPNLNVTTNPANSETIAAGGISFVGLQPTPGAGGHSGVAFGAAAPTTATMSEANCAVRQGFIYFTSAVGNVVHMQVTHVNRHMVDQHFWVRVQHTTINIYRWVRFTITTTVGDWRPTGNWQNTGTGFDLEDGNVNARRVGTANVTGAPPSLDTNFDTLRWNPTSTMNPTMWMRHAILPGTSREIRADWFKELVDGNGMNGQPMDTRGSANPNLGDRVAFVGAGMFVGGHGNVGGEPNVTMVRSNNLTANSTTGPNPRNLSASHNASITISAPTGEYSPRFYVLRVMLELVEHRTTGAMQSTTWATSTLRMQEVDIVFFVAPPPSQSSVPSFTRARGETITLGRRGTTEPGFRFMDELNVSSQATELRYAGLGTNQGIFNSRVATAGNLATTHLSWSFNESAQTIVITVQQWCNNRTFSLQVSNAMGQTIWVDFRITTPNGQWTPQGDFTSAAAAAMTGTNRLGIAHTTVMPFIHGNNLIPDGGNWDFNNNGTGIPTLWKTRALETNSVTYINATEFFTANTGSRDRVVFDMVHGVSINDGQGGRVSVALAGDAVGGHAPQIRLNIQSGTFDSVFFVINAYVALREIHNANAHHMFEGNIRVNIIFTIVQPVTQTSVPHFGGTTRLNRGVSLTINRSYHHGNDRGIGDLNVIARSNRQSVGVIEFSNAANAISGTLSNEGVFLNAGMTQPASTHLSWTLTANALYISGFYTILTNQSFFVGVRTDRGLVIPVEFRVTTQRDLWNPAGNAWNTAGTAVRYNPNNPEGSYKVGMSNTQTVPPGTDAPFNGTGSNPELGGWRFNPHHGTPALTMWVERVIHPTLTAAAYFTFTPQSFFQQGAGNNDFDVLTFGRSFTFWQNNQGGRITGIGTNPGAPLASVDNIGFTALTIRIAPGAPASFDDLFFTMRVRVQEQERAAVSAGRVFSYVYAYVVFRLRAEPPGQTAIPSFTLARGTAIAAPFVVVGNTIPALNVDDSDNPLSTQLRFENFAAGSAGNANYANRTGIFLDANTSRPARDHLAWTMTATQISVSEVRAWSPGLSFWIEISNDVGIYTWIRFVITTTVENYARTGGWEPTAGGVVAHEPSRQTRVGMPTTSAGPGARSTGENGMSWNFSHAITGTNHPAMWVMRSIDPGSYFDVRATDFFTLSSNDATRDALVFTEDRWLVNNQGGRISLTSSSPGGQLGAFASTVRINIGSDAITGFTPQFYFLRLVLQWRENSAANNGHLFTHFGSGGNQVVYVVFTITQPPRQLDNEIPVFEVYRGAEVGTSGVLVRGSNPPLHLNVSRTSDDKGFTLLNVSDFHNNAQSSQYIEFVGMGDNTGIFLTRGTAQPATEFLSWIGNATGFRITNILAVANRAFYIRVRNDRGREGWISFRLTTVSRGWDNAGGAEAWTETQAWHNAAEGFRVGRAVTPVEANPDAVPFTSWYFNRRNPMALTMWVEQPILPGEYFEFRATDFFTAIDPDDSVVFTAFSGDGGINFNFPENQPGISLTSHMAPAPMQMHAERLQINVALGNYPSQFFYFAAHVELRERSVVNNRILHRGPIPIFVVFRVDNVRSRLSNMIHANLNVGAARTIPLSDFAVDPNGDRMNIVDVVVPQREWLPVDRFGRAVPIPTSANPLFGVNQGIPAMGAGRQNQLTRYAPSYNLDINNGVATHHPFNDGADDRLNYRLGVGTIGHAQGTLPTGFSPNLVTRLPDDFAPSLVDTNSPLSNSAFARVAIVQGGQSLTITGLRPSRWQYHPDRAIPDPVAQGFRQGAVGHFYILVRIQDDGAVSDLGIWLPIAISINPRAIGERDARPANLTMEAGSDEIGTRAEVSLWQGGGVQYFSPFGAGTPVASAASLLSSAGTFGGSGMAALGPISPIAQSPDHHWSAVTGSSNNNATRALEEGIFIDWRYMHTDRNNLHAEGGVDVNGQIGSQERFLDGEGFGYLTHTTNFHTYFEAALVPLYLPRAAIARFSPQELNFAVAQRGLLRTQVGGTGSSNLTLGDVNSELSGSEADIEIVSFYGLRITALRSTLGLNLEFGIPVQSVREGLRMYQPAFGTMPAAVSLRTTARLLIGIVNSGPEWISYEAFDGAAAGSTGHHYGQSAFFNDTINSPIFENDYNNPIYQQVNIYAPALDINGDYTYDIDGNRIYEVIGVDNIRVGYQQILVGYNRTPTGVFNLHIPRDAVYAFSVYDFVHDADIAVDFDRSLYNPRGAENAARQGAMASEISRARPVMQAGAPGFGSAASLTTVMNDRLRFETPELETVQINYTNVTRVVPLSGRYAQMTMQQGAFGWSGIHAQFTISAIYRSPHVPTVFVLEAVDSQGASIELVINVFVINSAPEIQDRACYFNQPGAPSQSFDFSVADSTRGDMPASPDRTTNTNVYPDVNYGEAVGGPFRAALYTTREYLAHELARDIDDVTGAGLSFVGMPQVVTFDRPITSRADLHAAFNSTAMISLGDSVMRAEFTQGTSNRAGHTVLSLTAISSTEGFQNGVWVAFRVSDGHIVGGMLMIIRVRVFNSRVRFNEDAFTLRNIGADTVQLPHGRYLAVAQDDTTEPFYFTSSQGMIGTVPGINMGNSVLLGTSPDGLQHIIPVAGTVAYRGQLPTVPTHFFGQSNAAQFNTWGSLQTGIGGNSVLGTDFFRVFVPDGHTVLSHGWNNGQIAPGAFELVWFERQGGGQYNPVTVGTGRQNLHWALRMTLPPAHFADSALRISFAIADSDQEVHGGRAGGFATHGRSNHNDTQHNEVRHFTLHVVQSARTLLNNFTDLTYNGAHTLNHTLRGRRHTGGSTVEPNAEYHISGHPFNTISFDGITVPGAGVDGSAPSSIYVPYAYFASAWLSAPQGGNASPSAIGLATTYTSLRTTASGIDAAAARASLSLRSGDRVWTGGTFTQNPYITVEFLGQDTNTARFLNPSSPYYMGNRLIRYLVGPGTASGITSEYNGTTVITDMTNAAQHRDVTSGLRITKNDIRGDDLVLSVSVMAWGSAGGLFNAASEPVVIDVPLRVENDPIEVQSLGGQVMDDGITTTVPGGAHLVQNGMPVLDVLTDMNIGARTVGLVNTSEPDSFQAQSRRDFNFGFNGETVNRNNQLGPAATRNTHRERAMFLARSVNFDFNANNAGFNDFETRNSTQGQTSVRDGFFGGQTAMDNAIADPSSFNANRVNPNAGFERFFRITNLMQTNNITTGSDSDSFAIIPIRRTQLNTDLYSQDTNATAPSPESFGLRQCTRTGSLTQGSWYFPLHLLVYDEFAQSGWYNASMHAVLIRVFIFNAAPQANSGFLTVNPEGNLIGAVPYRTIRVMSNTSRTFSLREMLFEGDARVSGMHFMTRQEIMMMIPDPLERMTTDYVMLYRGNVLSGTQNGIAFILDDADNTRSLTISAGQRLPDMDLADRAGALEFVFADAMGGGFGPWTGSASDRERRATISFEIRFNNSPPTLTPEIIMGEQLITLRTGDWFRLAVGCRNAFTNNGARQVGTINNLQPGFDGTTGWWQQASDQNRNFSQTATDFVPGSGHLGDFIVASHERPWSVRFGTVAITRPGSDVPLSAGASELTPFTNHNMLYSSFTQNAFSPLSLEFRAVGVVDRLNIAIPVYDEQNARTMLRLQIRIESTPPALIDSHPGWSALGLSRDAQSGRFDVRMYVGDELSFELLHFVYDADRGDNERLFLRNFGVAHFMINNQPRSGDGIIAIDYGAFGPSGRRAFTISAHNFHGIGLNDEQNFSTVVFDVQDPQGPLWQRVELRVTTMRSPLNYRSDAVRDTTVTVRSAQEQADAEPNDINVVVPLVGPSTSSYRNTTVIVDNDFGALNTRYDVRVYSLINVSEVGGVHGAAINPLSTDFIQNRENHLIASFRHNLIGSGHLFDREVRFDPAISPNIALGVLEFWRFVDLNSFTISPSGCSLLLRPLTRTPSNPQGVLGALPLLIVVTRCNARTDDEHANSRDFRLNLRIQNSRPVAVGNTGNNGWSTNAEFNHLDGSFLSFHGRGGSNHERTFTVFEQGNIGASGDSDFVLFRDRDLDETITEIDVRWVATHQIREDTGAIVSSPQIMPGSAVSYRRGTVNGNPSLTFAINHRVNFAGTVQNANLPTKVVYEVGVRDAMRNHAVDAREDALLATTLIYVVIWPSTPQFTMDYADNLPSNMSMRYNATQNMHELLVAVSPDASTSLNIANVLAHRDLIPNNINASDRIVFERDINLERFSFDSISNSPGIQNAMFMGHDGSRQEEGALFSAHTLAATGIGVPNTTIVFNALTRYRGTTVTAYLHIRSEITGLRTAAPLRIILTTANDAPTLRTDINPVHDASVGADGVATIHIFAQGGERNVSHVDVDILDFFTDTNPYDTNHWQGGGDTFLRIANPSVGLDARNPHAVVSLFNLQTVRIQPSAGVYGQFQFHLLVADGPGPILSRFFPIPAPYEGGSVIGYPFSIDNFRQNSAQIAASRAHNQSVTTDDKFIVVRFVVYVTRSPYDVHINNVLNIPQFSTHRITPSRLLDVFAADTTWQRDRTDAEKAAAVEVNNSEGFFIHGLDLVDRTSTNVTIFRNGVAVPNSELPVFADPEDEITRWSIRANSWRYGDSEESIEANTTYLIAHIGVHGSPDAPAIRHFTIRSLRNFPPALRTAFEGYYEFGDGGSTQFRRHVGSIVEDPEGDVLTLVSVHSVSSVIVAASRDGNYLVLDFRGRGQSQITVQISDAVDTHEFTFIARNHDLPNPNIFLRMWAAVQMRPVMYGIILAIIILLIIILIIVIAVIKRRQRTKAELEALLIAELEMEEQMLKISQSLAAEPPFGYLGGPGYGAPPPPMMLGSGGAQQYPTANPMMLNAGQVMPQSSIQDSNFNNPNPYNFADDDL